MNSINTHEDSIKAIAELHAGHLRALIGGTGLELSQHIVDHMQNAIVDALDKMDDKALASELLRVAGDRDGWFRKYLDEADKVNLLGKTVYEAAKKEMELERKLKAMETARDDAIAAAKLAVDGQTRPLVVGQTYQIDHVGPRGWRGKATFRGVDVYPEYEKGSLCFECEDGVIGVFPLTAIGATSRPWPGKGG